MIFSGQVKIMTLPILDKELLFSGRITPPEWAEDLLPAIAERVKASARKVVVLDDDPTGTQTVHDIPVLTDWAVSSLKAELQSQYPAFYILTNSRSLTVSEACALNQELGTHLKQAADEAQVEVEVISRSDSTLRGHFPDEVDALASALGIAERPYLMIPCFFEGGRYTFQDIHYVTEGDLLIPAAQTAYAQDAAFGYCQSDLRRWIEEKTKGRIAWEQVRSISLDDLRNGGPESVQALLSELTKGSACVINALSYRDLEVFVLGLLQAESRGHRFLFRSAASFVRVRAGMEPHSLLKAEDLAAPARHGGLFVAGSYVPKTTAQIEALLKSPDLAVIELSVRRLLNAEKQLEEISHVTQEMNQLIGDGQDVLIYTSRELLKGVDAGGSLEIGRRVSDSLIEIVRGLRHQPRYIVAKGGITSSDIAVKGLNVRRAIVMGQVLPGVPAWKLGPESRYPGMAYIVFPGNVGENNALVEIKNLLAFGSIKR